MPSLTAYDHPTARLLEEAGVPMLLVGDSLGMVVLGYPDTTSVTMADMRHHLRAVVRGASRALVGCDLPYRSYDTVEQAVANARSLMEEGIKDRTGSRLGKTIVFARNHKHAVHLAEGEVLAECAAGFFHVARAAEHFPAVGDWVAVARREDQ